MMEMDADDLIIGAGVSGLVTALELARAGHRVCIAEARTRLGGRIWTWQDDTFSFPVEYGAEFVHGELPLTLQLLQRYKIETGPMKGGFWRAENDRLVPARDFIEHAGILESGLKKIKEDMPLSDFLATLEGGEKAEEARRTARQFVEGYDAADPERASTLAFRDEWLGEDEQQTRPLNGFGSLIDALVADCKLHGVEIYTGFAVHVVQWNPQKVILFSGEGSSEKKLHGKRVVITVPLGVLQRAPSNGGIRFDSPLPAYEEAFRKLGYGPVVKLLLEFSEPFWKSTKAKHGPFHSGVGEMAFLFTDGFVPAWWTQSPADKNLLTGWIGGPRAALLAGVSDQEILEKALAQLAGIFFQRDNFPPDLLLARKVVNWGADPFSYGAYNYATVDGKKIKEFLRQPVDSTIYFAGEGVYSGNETGMVEAAIGSGYETARKMKNE